MGLGVVTIAITSGAVISLVFAGYFRPLVIIGGFPLLATVQAVPHIVNLPSDPQNMLSGAFLAFLAFIGFEDIVHMAEKTKDPNRYYCCRYSVDARNFRGSLRTCCRRCCILS